VLSVLIARPLEAAQALAEQIDLPGVQSLVMPFYTFAAQTPDLDVAAWLGSTKGRRLVVFTSPRAVEFGLHWIPENQRSALEFATVGDATRLALEAAGVTVSWLPEQGYTSEDLLALNALRSDPGAALVMCAPDGRGVLKPALQDSGWLAENVMVYQRVAIAPVKEQLDRLMAADSLLTVWTSTSALEGAEQNLPPEAWSKILGQPALVISSRIKHHLQARGAADIHMANGPGNPDLLQSIRTYVEDHHRWQREI